MLPSRTIKDNQWRIHTQVNINSIPLGSMTQVCGIVSNRLLLSSSGEQPRAMITAYIFGMVDGIPLNNTFNKGNTLVSFRGNALPCMVTAFIFFILCIYFKKLPKLWVSK